ncbi:hypothetical protein Cgig2_008408 [Carnegiea gigantea]|uniref:Uncharacterized protein n=1 Tax=Carnegiea gigantea TaxID=171969 RepID=A0A9Q1Q7C0_9CARY|nr:hypothetical protein Cgig2_008408 [Carnegiea gigantea]
MGVLEVLRLVKEAMGEGLQGGRMWYSLKCNRFELLPLGRDGDVKKLMNGNDEYAYLYVAGSEGLCVTWVPGNEACKGGHIQKLGLKVNKQKTELEKWKNGVGDRIEKKLANIGSVADVKLFNTTLGEYGVLLTNNRSLVKLWVYDYVGDCYKVGSQSMRHMNRIHPMETYDSVAVDNTTGLVVGGEALDDRYNRRILPPLNPRPQGRPQRGELNLKGKASRSESAQNAERLDTTETRARIRALILMQMRQLLLYPWRIYLKTTTYRRHNMKVTRHFLTHIPR